MYMVKAIKTFLLKSKNCLMFGRVFRSHEMPDEAMLQRMVSRDMAIMACALCFTGAKQYSDNPQFRRAVRETAKQLIATKAFVES
jgi:hypothetical protein